MCKLMTINVIRNKKFGKNWPSKLEIFGLKIKNMTCCMKTRNIYKIEDDKSRNNDQ